MSMSPERRERLDRERQSLRETADGLDKILRAVCADGALCGRLDEIVDGRGIEVLAAAAAKLSGQAAGIEFDLVQGDAS
jgi:hypothetical protein